MNHDISDLDRAFVTALQMYPRASWTQLAPILHTSVSTLSRRWDALSAAGLVWTSATIMIFDQSADVHGGVVEIQCATGHRERVVAELINMPEIFSIATCAGAHDLVCVVFAESLHSIDVIVNERISMTDGITGASINFASSVSVEGSEFRLGDLSDDQVHAVSQLRPLRHTSSAPPTSAQLSIARELAHDVRMTAADIARATGYSHAYVQRQIALIQSAPWFLPRIDFSVNDFGLTAVYFWLDCLVGVEPALARFVQRSQGIRLAMPVVARANLLLSVWLPGLDRISEFERELVKHVPGVTVIDRWPQIASRMRAGVALDARGRHSPDIRTHRRNRDFRIPSELLAHMSTV